jgi:hypothetical protein
MTDPDSRIAELEKSNMALTEAALRSTAMSLRLFDQLTYLVGLLDSYGIPVDHEMFSEELEMPDEPAPQRRADIALIN